MTKGRMVAVMAALIGALVLVSSAPAAGKKPKPYRGSGGVVENQVQSAQGSGTLGALPFTGLDLALIVGAGFVLVIVGGTVRRLNRRQT